MLVLGIRYLTGCAVASEPDTGQAEWPPHPGRVFMALAAAHFQTGSDPAERSALLWLEGLEQNGEPLSPDVIAPPAMMRDVVTQFVPVNPRLVDEKKARMQEKKKGKKPPPPLQSAPGIIRTRQPRTFSRAWLEKDSVFLVWHGVEPDSETSIALADLCAKVTRVGHSSSLVQMWLAGPDEPGEPTWVPDDQRSQVYLRIAPRGTLEYLERQFNREAVEEYAALQVAAADPGDQKAQRSARKQLREKFGGKPPSQLRPNLSVFQGYAPPVELKQEPAGTVFSPQLIVLRLEPQSSPHRRLDLQCALTVAVRWREALLSQSNGLSEDVERMLSGHDADGAPLEEPHLALLPLAFVAHEHADGHLLGLGAALPNDVSRETRRGVLQVLGRVSELRLGRLGVWQLMAITQSRPPWNLTPSPWTAHPDGATEWATVTPVAFDRHPKAKGKAAYRANVASMISRCCARVGLPQPRQVILTPVSVHEGVPAGYAFPRLKRKDGSLRRHTHAIITFDEPVQGPMLLGAGRYRGYGFCRPLQDSPGSGVET